MYKVLIVEDDPDFLEDELAMKAWAECGFTIVGDSEHGEKALKFLEKNPVDLVVTDIRMPIMDGVELLKTIRAKGDNDTVVVFMTAFSSFEYAKDGIKNGVFDYIEKPLTEKKLSALLLRVRSALDKHKDDKIDHVMTDLLKELGVSSEDPFVYQIAAYCVENYKSFLSADELAEEMGLNAVYFRTQFKTHFGIRPNEFANRVKIAYAVEMLKNGKYKVYEISDMLGFSEYKYFAEKFKALKGVSPTDYLTKTEERK